MEMVISVSFREIFARSAEYCLPPPRRSNFAGRPARASGLRTAAASAMTLGHLLSAAAATGYAAAAR